jgi:hypothetical protein
MVQDDGALGDEEQHEPRADDRERIARLENPKRLRQDVEERDGHDDAAGQGNHRRQFAAQAEREEAACERGEDRDPRERDCDPGQRNASSKMRTILVITARRYTPRR